MTSKTWVRPDGGVNEERLDKMEERVGRIVKLLDADLRCVESIHSRVETLERLISDPSPSSADEVPVRDRGKAKKKDKAEK